MRTLIHIFFQKWSKSVQDKWPKVHVVIVTKNKTHFGILRCNTWRDFRWIFNVSAHRDSSLIFLFSSRSIQVLGRCYWKTPPRLPTV